MNEINIINRTPACNTVLPKAVGSASISTFLCHIMNLGISDSLGAKNTSRQHPNCCGQALENDITTEKNRHLEKRTLTSRTKEQTWTDFSDLYLRMLKTSWDKRLVQNVKQFYYLEDQF